MYMNILDREARDRALAQAVHRPRVFRLRTCPFDVLDDKQFKARYRFTRPSFFQLVDMIDEDIRPSTRRSSSFTSAQKLAITLQLLATNSFQITSGDTVGASQPTVSRVLSEVTDWFVERQGDFIQWPSPAESLATQRRVFARTKLPGVVGMIDGSHMKIIAPSEDEPTYVNRKGYHSINMSAIVNDKYEFLWITTRYPGSAHDSRVFRESAIHRAFETGQLSGRLIGDSAYRAESYLIKVHLGVALTPRQDAYNKAVCNARVAVEQSFGQLKRQWHILHSELRYNPTRASAILTTCVCLRNAALAFGDSLDDLDDINDDYDQPIAPPGESVVDTTNGRSTIDSITDNYFVN